MGYHCIFLQSQKTIIQIVHSRIARIIHWAYHTQVVQAIPERVQFPYLHEDMSYSLKPRYFLCLVTIKQRIHHVAESSFLKLLLLLPLQKVFVNFHLVLLTQLPRCFSQVWGSCFDYKLFEHYISSQKATFCCRQIELFSYKYSQYFSNILITNSNGY